MGRALKADNPMIANREILSNRRVCARSLRRFSIV
jgi:hypothetical protein